MVRMVLKEDGTTVSRIYFNTTNNSLVLTDGSNTDTLVLKGDEAFFQDRAFVSGTISVTSDKKFKDNVQTIESALDKTAQLRGVTYTDNRSGESKIGVIAQEVEAVLPTVVTTDESKYVDYNQLIPMLIESVKELKHEIETLKNKCQCK